MPFFLPVCQSLLENSLNINSVFLICISSDTRPSSSHIRLFAQIAFQLSRKYRFIFTWNLYFWQQTGIRNLRILFFFTWRPIAPLLTKWPTAPLCSLYDYRPYFAHNVFNSRRNSNRCFPLCFDYDELHKKLLLTSQI